MNSKSASTKSKLNLKILSALSAVQLSIFRMHIFSSFYESACKTMMYGLTYLISVLCYWGDSLIPFDARESQLAFGGAVVAYGLSVAFDMFPSLHTRHSSLKKLLAWTAFSASAFTVASGMCHVFAPNAIVNIKDKVISWLAFANVSEINYFTVTAAAIPIAVLLIDTVFFSFTKPPDSMHGGFENKLKNITVVDLEAHK